MRYLITLISVTAVAILAACATNTTKNDTPPPAAGVKATVNTISPSDALQKTRAAYSQFIDVRTPSEFAAGHAERAVNIPLNELTANLGRIEKNEPVYVICETGRRSKEAADILSKNGYSWVFDVAGGTSAWREAGLPIEVSAANK
jgi:rhodanese-related sulfurtransferase